MLFFWPVLFSFFFSSCFGCFSPMRLLKLNEHCRHDILQEQTHFLIVLVVVQWITLITSEQQQWGLPRNGEKKIGKNSETKGRIDRDGGKQGPKKRTSERTNNQISRLKKCKQNLYAHAHTTLIQDSQHFLNSQHRKCYQLPLDTQSLNNYNL